MRVTIGKKQTNKIKSITYISNILFIFVRVDFKNHILKI